MNTCESCKYCFHDPSVASYECESGKLTEDEMTKHFENGEPGCPHYAPEIANDVYPMYIMQTVRLNLGLDANDKSRDSEINEMDTHEVFDRYLTWNGIIGYTSRIKQAIEDIYGIELPEEV